MRWAACAAVFACAQVQAASCDGFAVVRQLNRGHDIDAPVRLDLAVVPGKRPAIAFYGRLVGDAERALWLHRCRNASCALGTTRKLDTYNFFDGDTQVLLRASDRPLVFNNKDSRLHVFDCADADCTSGSNRPLLYENGSLDVTARMRSDGRPVIAYFDQYSRAVEIITCDDADCTSVEQTFVPAEGAVAGSFPRVVLALTKDDRPVLGLSSFNGGSPYTQIVACESTDCEQPSRQTLASEYNFYLDIEMRSDDRPVMHFTPQLGAGRLYVCNDTACVTPEVETLGGYSTYGITMGPGNLPWLHVSSGILGFYRCETETCSVQGDFQETGTVSGGGAVLEAGVLAGGEPLVAWAESLHDAVRVATCPAEAIESIGFEPTLVRE